MAAFARREHGYGEVPSASVFADLLPLLGLCPEDTFLDAGSGLADLVLLAVATAQCKGRGIEVVPRRHAAAVEGLDRLLQASHACAARGCLGAAAAACAIVNLCSLEQGDCTLSDLGGVTVAFANNVLWQEEDSVALVTSLSKVPTLRLVRPLCTTQLTRDAYAFQGYCTCCCAFRMYSWPP